MSWRMNVTTLSARRSGGPRTTNSGADVTTHPAVANKVAGDPAQATPPAPPPPWPPARGHFTARRLRLPRGPPPARRRPMRPPRWCSTTLRHTIATRNWLHTTTPTSADEFLPRETIVKQNIPAIIIGKPVQVCQCVSVSVCVSVCVSKFNAGDEWIGAVSYHDGRH